ncbi:putative rnase p rpr2 rpp21 subunit domain-containing protein [Erysiphe necator]|uniref:Putative rnase p rpr2 rpp21 subunit domain-containing protein n=1 Tax=Uncinula necator TaxID=52586 RepID=A0A0B1PFB7_UNCNE|nr:putative rnase p rpr2 rpp21 subunit domain-containing protein [Erysiphe necator]
MSKGKSKICNRKANIPNKILYSRVSFLYQAAVYLATINNRHHCCLKNEDKQENPENSGEEMQEDEDKKTGTNAITAAAVVQGTEVLVGSDVKYDISDNARGEGKKKGILNPRTDLKATQGLTSSMDLTAPTIINSRKLISELRAISLKAQIRLSPHIKNSICKTCSTLLIDGTTCSNEIENKSKEGRKPWADILVKRCYTCDSVKRFPLSAQRQKRRKVRTPKNSPVAEEIHVETLN